MKPKLHPSHNTTLHNGHVEIPVYVNDAGEVTSCWEVNDEDLLRIQKSREVWVTQSSPKHDPPLITLFTRAQKSSEPLGQKQDDELRFQFIGAYVDGESRVNVVMNLNGTAIGSCSVYLSDDPEMLPYLNWLHVHPKHRKQGFGESMIRRIIQHFEDAGHPGIQLCVKKQNGHLVHWYKKLGFTQECDYDESSWTMVYAKEGVAVKYYTRDDESKETKK